MATKTKYVKINDNEFQVVETKEETCVVKLDFIETDIAHKDKLIANLQDGITNLEAEKAKLIELRDSLKAVK